MNVHQDYVITPVRGQNIATFPRVGDAIFGHPHGDV